MKNAQNNISFERWNYIHAISCQESILDNHVEMKLYNNSHGQQKPFAWKLLFEEGFKAMTKWYWNKHKHNDEQKLEECKDPIFKCDFYITCENWNMK